MTTIAALLRAATSASARRDFEVLIAHTLGVGRAYLYAHGETTLGKDQLQRTQNLLQRYLTGIPVAYLTGSKDFWRLTLEVSPDVLIPRPETELLVELALERLAPNARVLDLGTGSGAIALAIKQERADCAVVATDVSIPAIEVARRNAAKHGLDVRIYAGDWYAAVSGTFDMVVSNPPYICATDPHLESLVGEPSLALIGGRDGLDALRTIIDGAPTRLTPGGRLLVEHGFDQAEGVRDLFERAGFACIQSHRDVAGHERVTLAER